MAQGLARDGFEVAVNYHTSRAAAEEVVASIVGAGGRGALLGFDVAARDQCEETLSRDIDRYGPFYGVVCNAGVAVDAPFPALAGDAWDRVLRTNLDGFYNVIRPLAMPMIRARQGGRIVTMSSVAGLVGRRGQVNYSASKAGLIGATKALAQELAKRGITVNSVAPGLIASDMTGRLAVEDFVRLIPMRRLGRPEDVAATVSFLFSEGAAYITGQVISVNGGLV